MSVSWKKYAWDVNDRLTQVFDALTQGSTRFGHDALGNLAWAQYADNRIVHRAADETGNVYETREKADRKYSAAGALLESRKYIFKYDEEGNLISKTEKATERKTKYEWYASGMLKQITKPDGKTVTFKYDALGRRIEKTYDGTITRWLWDGNVPLHEWSYKEEERPKQQVGEWGDISYDRKEPIENLITWLFDEGTLHPSAKIEEGKTESIICDYLGTPQMMFDEKGEKTWEAIYDIYGRCITLTGEKSSLPFRYQGQYEDEESGLYYNRFRYYSAEEGVYVSQDPIGLLGGIAFYGFVKDTNIYTDKFGWYSDLLGSGMGHHLVPRSVAEKLGITELSKPNSLAWYPNNGVNTAALHGQMHTNLINEGVPYHGSKFTGTADEFFDKGAKAYKNIDVKGYMKIPGTDDILFENMTPGEALDKLKELYKNKKIPCKQ